MFSVDLVAISFSEFGNLTIQVNMLFVGLLVFAVLLFWKIFVKKRKVKVNIEQISFGTNGGSAVLSFSHREQEIAYKLWVELITRKIALSFDEQNDVIVEVYDSAYQFFGIARNLMKEIPYTSFSGKSNLVWITEEVLNNALRPHLTCWQAKFRRWYSEEIERKDNSGMSPQEIQTKYPYYDALIKDLKNTNRMIQTYCGNLERIAYINSPSERSK